MQVILDTNIFVADFWMRRAPFTLLADGLKRISGTLVVPTVVLDEVEGKYRERLEEATRDLSKAQKAVRELHNPFDAEAATAPDEKVRLTAYSMFLRERLNQLGAQIAPLPKVSHADVLKRALLKRPPFDQHGHGGYRDVLIWESVLEISREPRTVCFVSMDGDFGTKDGLHAELATDLDEFARPRFEFFPTLAAFNEKWITPTLKRLDKLVADFNGGTELTERVQDSVLDSAFELEHEIFGEAALGHEYASFSVRLDDLAMEPGELKATQAHQLANGWIVLTGSQTFKAGVRVHISELRSQFLADEALHEFDIRAGDTADIDTGSHWFEIEFAATLAGPDVEHLAITSVDIASIAGDNDKIELG